MSDAIYMQKVMLQAHAETQLSLMRQADVYNARLYRVWQNLAIMEKAEESPTGIINRSHFYRSVEVDNARFDGGFWGDTHKGCYRTHNESKKKGFKGWR